MEKSLKITREMQQIIYKKIPLRLLADFSAEVFMPEWGGRLYLK